jgi:hypothetical protein
MWRKTQMRNRNQARSITRDVMHDSKITLCYTNHRVPSSPRHNTSEAGSAVNDDAENFRKRLREALSSTSFMLY